MIKQSLNIILLLLLLWFAVSCSTTKNLPVGEVLYTGLKEIKYETDSGVPIQKDAESDVTSALSYAPNNALFGSSKIRVPFPMGLWIYNAFKTDKKTGFNHWFFKTFAAKPVFISKVEPETRCQVGEKLLDDYGYFGSDISYKVDVNAKNPRKAKLSYLVKTHKQFEYEVIHYPNATNPIDSVIRSSSTMGYLKKGTPFNITNLEKLRKNVTEELKNKGYYYFYQEYISFYADTTIQKNKIYMSVRMNPSAVQNKLHPWKIGKISYNLTTNGGMPPTDSITYKGIEIHYRKKLRARAKILFDALDFHTDDLYSDKSYIKTLSNLNRLNMFRLIEIQLVPQDTLPGTDILNMRINATFDLPMDAEFEANLAYYSNSQFGPGVGFIVTHRNMFGGGEQLSTRIRASYEWETGGGVSNEMKKSLLNSFEFGITNSLMVPRLLLPHFIYKNNTYPASTYYRVFADWLNRAWYFRMITFGVSNEYNFRNSPQATTAFVPIKLTYNYMQNRTPAFDSIVIKNPALYESLRNKFIPSTSLSYRYDNSNIKTLRNNIWWQGTLTSAGNLLYGIYALSGAKKVNGGYRILGNRFSQFVKLTSDLRFSRKITDNHKIVYHFLFAAAKAYANSLTVPYNEQFYVGGPNSIRAFQSRSIGPGSYHATTETLFSYLSETGDLKLEANIEYRFRILGNLHGATFLDAGNIWLLQKEPFRENGQFKFNTFAKQIAVGTGFGLRYSLSYVILRADIGIPIHAPYDTGKSGYFNIKSWHKMMVANFAVGYPF